VALTGFWENLERDIEERTVSQPPMKGMMIPYCLGLAPFGAFLSAFARSFPRGWDGLRSAVYESVFVFGVAARRYEAGSRSEPPLEAIRGEFVIKETGQ